MNEPNRSAEKDAGAARTAGCVADPKGPCLKVDWLCGWCRRSLGQTRPIPPGDVCHEFVDTGRCGHSDAEHDALADAPIPPAATGQEDA